MAFTRVRENLMGNNRHGAACRRFAVRGSVAERVAGLKLGRGAQK
jgi:hypothetical protein